MIAITTRSSISVKPARRLRISETSHTTMCRLLVVVESAVSQYECMYDATGRRCRRRRTVPRVQRGNLRVLQGAVFQFTGLRVPCQYDVDLILAETRDSFYLWGRGY